MKRKMKIAYLGAGTWGTALAVQLAQKGHEVFVWDKTPQVIQILKEKRTHPKLPQVRLPENIHYFERFEEIFVDADVIYESVTSEGIRPVFSRLASLGIAVPPIVITSKGIEQKTGLLFPEVIEEVLGSDNRKKIGILSGPSYAEEVIQNFPTSVVCSAYEKSVRDLIGETLNSEHFRVYPNEDIRGVAIGGATKNIIAIACAISDGIGFGGNSKAALVTRGLHEIRKLAVAMGAKAETLNGLSGLGDLFVTCSSTLSRNYRFGRLIAEGYSLEEAKKQIGMAVEGVYSCISAREQGIKVKVPLPITEATYQVLYKGLNPKEAVKLLFQRAIKEEHL